MVLKVNNVGWVIIIGAAVTVGIVAAKSGDLFGQGIEGICMIKAQL